MTEEKLQKKFKNQIKKYHSWCAKYLYNSRDPNTLLWYFNQHKHAVRVETKYYIIYKGEKYDVLDLVEIFKNGRENKCEK